MPTHSSIFRIILSSAIFITMEIAALNMLNNNGTLQNFFLSKYVHIFMGTVWGGSESLKNYFSLKKANFELAEENFALMQKLRKYEEVLTQASLDSLTNRFINTKGFRYIPGTIVKVSRNKQHNYLIISQGAADGVRPQSGLITSEGVVGIVDAVGEHYSYAISFKNSDLSISSRLGKSGAVGPLTWDGKSPDGAILKAIPLQHKFDTGDTVYTSGYSSIFPPGIPLGVTGAAKIVNGATYNINVKLFQNPGSAMHVVIVENTGKTEIEELEKKGGGE